MSSATLDEYTDAQYRVAQRALATLDRLDARLAEYYAAQRRHVRRSLRSMATVRLASGQGAPRDLTVWTRDVSESGMGFICPERIDDDWVLIGLETAPGHSVWFVADVVRRREVPSEEFWEHGVAFRGRVKD